MQNSFYIRYRKALAATQNWSGLWQDCYSYTLPSFGANAISRNGGGPDRSIERLFDATAPDAVDQLAASLLGHLTPPFTAWFGLKAGPTIDDEQASLLAPVLEKSATIMLGHFERSNLLVELHQCFLDLVIGGTACLFFEQTEAGADSAFRFTALPLREAVLADSGSGRLDCLYRTIRMSGAQLAKRYDVDEDTLSADEADYIEAIEPDDKGGYSLSLWPFSGDDSTESIAVEKLDYAPFIAFRWMKSPGEAYGRSPIMKVLPDIKTANKVVELILKNASIAVTGIWQAEDDGVLNPANIELVPGAIIPKAMGSRGLTPLEMPGRFDVSQLVLDDLRSRIRHALLIDRLPAASAYRMTATEILERSSEMGLLLGATYGRLQIELLHPLLLTAWKILRGRGEVPDLLVDGRSVQFDYRAPLARSQAQRHVQSTISWLQTVAMLGGDAMSSVDTVQASRYLGDALGVPTTLMLSEIPIPPTENLIPTGDELL